MTDDQLNTLGLWVLLPSLVVFLGLLIKNVIGTPRFVRRRRHRRQLVELEEMFTARQERDYELDWLRFKEVPKTELRDVLGRHGWRYIDEQIGPDAWLLRFTRQPATPAHPNARDRLRTELAGASIGVDGSYRLDTEQYEGLSLPEIKKEVNAAGFLVARLDPGTLRQQMVLTRQDTAVLAPDPTFIQGESTAQLRTDPDVVQRSEEIRRKTGVDALSERQLNEVRKQHRYWQKKFNRQGALATLYTIVGVIFLFATIDNFDLDDGETYFGLSVIAIMLLLAAIAIYKAVTIRRKRRAAIGPFLDARTELNHLHTQQ